MEAGRSDSSIVLIEVNQYDMRGGLQPRAPNRDAGGHPISYGDGPGDGCLGPLRARLFCARAAHGDGRTPSG